MRKALYGLRQAGRAWNTELNRFLQKQGFKHGQTEPCLYIRWKNGDVCLTLVYIDDVLAATTSVEQKDDLFKLLDKQYVIKDHGRETQYLCVKIDRSESSYCLQQKQYTREVLERCGFMEARKVGSPVDCTTRLVHEEPETSNEIVSYLYRAAVGELMYLARSTRPDIAFAFGCSVHL